MCNEHGCSHEVDPEVLGAQNNHGQDDEFADDVIEAVESIQIPDEIACTCNRDEMDNDYEHYDTCPFVIAYPARPLPHISEFKGKHTNHTARHTEQINIFRSFVSRATR